MKMQTATEKKEEEQRGEYDSRQEKESVVQSTQGQRSITTTVRKESRAILTKPGEEGKVAHERI